MTIDILDHSGGPFNYLPRDASERPPELGVMETCWLIGKSTPAAVAANAAAHAAHAAAAHAAATIAISGPGEDPSAASMADRVNGASPDIGVDTDDYRVAHQYNNRFCFYNNKFCHKSQIPLSDHDKDKREICKRVAMSNGFDVRAKHAPHPWELPSVWF